jgi:hypothetical protein
VLGLRLTEYEYYTTERFTTVLVPYQGRVLLARQSPCEVPALGRYGYRTLVEPVPVVKVPGK